MPSAATSPPAGSDDSRPVPTLYVAFELGNRDWKRGFTTGFGQPPRERTIDWRAQMTADFMAMRGWKTLAGRGSGPLLKAELRYLEGQQDPYFRASGHRRESPPGHLLLWVLCGRVIWLLEHLRAEGHDHLLRVGAPPWMGKLVKPVRAELSVSPERWPIVRTAVARQAVAVWLNLKPRTVQRKMYNRQRIEEELADSRARSREGFAFLYAVATPVEAGGPPQPVHPLRIHHAPAATQQRPHAPIAVAGMGRRQALQLRHEDGVAARRAA